MNSDTEHAAFLYDILTRKGLKVWWDKKCLMPGVAWEIGFTDGLLKSRIYISSDYFERVTELIF